MNVIKSGFEIQM